MAPTDKTIGVKIYKSERDYDDLVEEWDSLNINAAYVSERLLMDRAFRRAVGKFGIRLYAIFPFFSYKSAM